MKIIDRIAINRLISILTNFILSLIKIFNKKTIDNITPIKPDKKPFPWLRKQIDKVIKND
jgi:hypothetical protein